MEELSGPQIPLQTLNEPKKSKKKFFAITAAAAFLLVILIYGLLVLSPDNTATITQSLQRESNVSDATLSPTPFPFQEMTIPYLRARTYQSSLGEQTPVASNASYKSVLTSYTSDGLKINGQLTIPEGPAPQGGWPAVVFVHGYIPPASYQTLSNYASYVDYIAKNGFVVFKIDLRGHGNSEGKPGGSYYSSDYIIDVLNARAALKSSGIVNPGKIGLWGHSMAGNVIMRSLAAQPNIPAVVIWAGAVYSYEDLGKYGIDDNSYRPPANDTERQRKRRELFDKYGEFSAQSEFWKMVPATNYLQDIDGAVQLNHAIDDNVVDIGYSRDLDLLLDKTDITHELNEYTSGGHNISGASFNSAMNNTVDFFRKNL